jgi:hypothetical protein
MIFAPPAPVRYAAIGFAILSAVVAFATFDFRLAGGIKDGVFFLFGGTLLVLGFGALRRKRLIENVPSSRIRSVAMGLAELVGRVRQRTPQRAPFTGTTCAYFRFTVEKYTGGKNKRWQVVEKGESAEPFWLEDETGRLLVNPAGAEAVLRTAYREVRRDGGIFSHKKRYTEYRLIEGQRAYVLGTVGHARDRARERREDLAGRLRDLKADAERLRAFDADRDGRISDAEWGGAVAAVKDDLLRREAAEPRDPGEEIVIGKGQAEDTFILADRGEASLVRHLNIQVAVALLLGVLFTLIPSVSLLARAGALPRALAIDWGSSSVTID